jgi:hypothetical protein
MSNHPTLPHHLLKIPLPFKEVMADVLKVKPPERPRKKTARSR